MTQPHAGQLPASTGRRGLPESRLRALAAIGRAAVTAAPDDAMEAVLRAARLAMQGDSASMGVWVPERQHLRTLINEGDLADWEERRPKHEAYPADQSTWLAGMPDGYLGLVTNLDDPSLPADDRAYLLALGKHTSLSLPVLLAGEWWGEMFMARRAESLPFTDADLDWGAAVAAQVGAALEAIEHLSRVADLARTDPLTGLTNRRAVNEWMDAALAQWRDSQVSVGLLVCDVNGLKRVNDVNGHEAGDRLLVAFARQLESVAQRFGASLVARLGGDEFTLGFSGVAVDQVVAAAEQLCETGWNTLPEGVACGVAVTGGDAGPVESASRLFRLADATQYRAKRTRSRRPVIAGAALPREAAIPLLDDDALTPDRRLMRADGRRDTSHLIESALRALDQARDEPVSARLTLVGDVTAHYVDAVGWWLSIAATGSPSIRTAEFALYRQLPGKTAEELHAHMDDEYPLEIFPMSALALDGDSFLVHADDPSADAAELAVLTALHATGVVGAGGQDVDGDRWLLELFTDGLSGSVRDLPAVLRVLVLAALHPSRPPQP